MFSLRTKDYYAVLNLPDKADRKDVRAAYLALALQYHPDKTGGDLIALDRFRDVQEAYEILGDSDKKAQYNLTRKSTVFDVNDEEEEDDFELDQKIWDEWQASWTGEKATSFSKPEGYSRPEGSFAQTAQFETPQTPPMQARFTDYSRLGGSREETAPHAAQGNENDAISISSDEDNGNVTCDDQSIPSSPSGNHWSFNDYYDHEYNEKPFLTEMRDRVEFTQSRYRTACKEADKAKIDLNYANTLKQKKAFQETLSLRNDTRESWKRVKGLREANLKKHERLAKECLRDRKKKEKEADAAARKEEALLKKLRQHQAHRAKTTAGAFGSFRVKKPRAAKRTSWYGGPNSDDESEGEWSKHTNWKP